MSPEQVRAARSWLGWSQADLAAKAHVGLSTIKDFEGGNRTPIANNLAAIQQALEGAGVEFVDDAKGKPKGVHVNGYSR
jgi:ribosome-binding protein aMBF1 (putative translation factor)